MSLYQDEKPPKELGPPDKGKKWIKTVEVTDGHDTEKWVQVDDVEGPQWPARDSFRLLNHDIRRQDAREKVTGEAKYAHDARPEGMLYGRLLLCRIAHAQVELNLDKAKQLAGVHAVVSLLGGGESLTGETSFLGQPLAAVAAETPDLCEDALRAIEAVISPLPWAINHSSAIAEGAPVVSKRRGSNISVSKRETSGDEEKAEQAVAGSHIIVEATYVNEVQHHCCLETHGAVVDYRGGSEATIDASTQANSGWLSRSPIPDNLGLEESAIRVRTEYMGGGFGSKFGPGVEGATASLLAKQTNRPVHLLLTRSDEFLVAGNRSGAVARMRGGVSEDGRLVGLVSHVDKLGGVGRGSNPGQPYIYSVEESYGKRSSVNTHTDSSRAMRAPGHPQASFAIESFVDECAYAIGHDPLEFRKRNLTDEVYHRQLDRVASEIGWNEHSHRSSPGDPEAGEPLVGIGFGIATWGGGGYRGNVVEVKIGTDGSVTASVASQDLGTGTRTYVAAIVAEEFGLETEQVKARIGDSFLGSGTGSGGSTTTASLAPSVRMATVKAAKLFREHLAQVVGVSEDKLSFAVDGIRVAGAANLEWKKACASLPANGLTAIGEFKPDLQGSGVHGAQAAKVEVDPLTGRIRVLKMVAIQDCGLPLNRLALRSQLNGGMIQSLSYALLEQRVLDEATGTMLNAGFDEYKIAGVMEIPEMVALIDDDDTRNVVIGMSEPAVIPGGSAIANAVFNACGARIRELPLTPDKILNALNEVS